MTTETEIQPVDFVTVGEPRLRRLAKHLIEGKLGHAQFDMTLLNDGDPYSCGTAGCALGECPILFPNDWHFNRWSDPVLKQDDDTAKIWAFTGAELFFGISFEDSYGLFYVGDQFRIDEPDLLPDATARQVGELINRFCDKKLATLKAGAA